MEFNVVHHPGPGMAENTLPDILSGNTTHAGCPAELSLHKSVEC